MTQKLCIVCVSGTLEKLQMAAMVASVAAATGEEVTVFLSMNALLYFVRDETSQPPGEGRFAELLRQDGVPGFRELFGHAVELGDAKLLPCSMAVDLLKLGPDSLQPEVGPPTGLTRFLSETEGARVMTF